jgi:chromosome partitioning protein
VKHSPQSPVIVSIANQKGGVGKTTTAVNLAASLAVMEIPTLLVDLDPQANASLGLGHDYRTRVSHVYDALLGKSSLADLMVKTDLEFLHLVPSHPDLVAAEVELVALDDRVSLLRNAVKSIPPDIRIVLIDCPPALGLLTLNALVASGWLLVPIQPEFYALDGLARLLQTLDRVRQCLNPSLSILGMVLTLYDRRNRLTHQVVSEVETVFPSHLLDTRIPRNVRLAESPSHGKPAILFDVHSPGAQAHLALAQEILERIPGLAEESS